MGLTQSIYESVVEGNPEAYGWRVLKVMPSSPCSGLGLVPYFDVLTHVNKTRLTRDESALVPMVQDGVPLEITVLSFVSKKSRSVTVTPNRSWGGDGLLGIMIRYDKFENAEDDVVHILDVFPGSPADTAGLQAYSDYLLGTSKMAFKGHEQLEFFLEKNAGLEAQVFVFNSKTLRVREVTIRPNPKWGGKGSLGCDVGVGLVHRLPVQPNENVDVDTASLVPEKRVSANPGPTSPYALQYPYPPVAAGSNIEVKVDHPGSPQTSTSSLPTAAPVTAPVAAPAAVAAVPPPTAGGFATVPLDNTAAATQPVTAATTTAGAAPSFPPPSYTSSVPPQQQPYVAGASSGGMYPPLSAAPPTVPAVVAP